MASRRSGTRWERARGWCGGGRGGSRGVEWGEGAARRKGKTRGCHFRVAGPPEFVCVSIPRFIRFRRIVCGCTVDVGLVVRSGTLWRVLGAEDPRRFDRRQPATLHFRRPLSCAPPCPRPVRRTCVDLTNGMVDEDRQARNEGQRRSSAPGDRRRSNRSSWRTAGARGGMGLEGWRAPD
jgi:hypothetical protein